MRRPPAAATAILVAVICLAAATTARADDPAPVVVPSTEGTSPASDVVVLVPCAAPCGTVPCCACPCPCGGGARWRFDVTLPLWLPSLQGNFGTDGGEVAAHGRAAGSLMADLGETTSAVDWFFSGAVAAERGPWRFAVAVIGARVSESMNLTILDLEATGTFEAVLGRAIASWEGWRRPVGRCGACLRAGPYAGVRAFSTSFDYSNVVGNRVQGSHTWFDPLVGFAAEVRTPRGWSLRGEADVGGVSSEQWSWAVSGTLRIPLSRRVGISIGWRFLDSTYVEGSGDRFVFDASLNGPVAALSIVF